MGSASGVGGTDSPCRLRERKAITHEYLPTLRRLDLLRQPRARVAVSLPVRRHALRFAIGDGRYAWPECSGRGGPWPIASARFTDDPEQVTCLRCLDILTRP